MTDRDFSIVIPVCHGGRFLEEALRSVTGLEFTGGRFELIVAAAADDAPSCAAVENTAAAAPFRVRLVRCASPRRSGSLNRACALAAGRILAFTDDDCVLPADWLRRIDAFAEGNPDFGAVGGGDDALAAGPFDHALDWALNSFVGSGGCRFRKGPKVGRFYPKLWNMAVPKEVALSAALPGRDGEGSLIFDESLPVHEDAELMARIERKGGKIHYAPGIRVSHSRDTTFTSLLRRNFDMARTCRREGMHRFAHRFLAGAVLGTALLAAAAAWWTLPRQLLILGAGMYAAALAAAAAAAAVRKRSAAVFPWVPAILFGLHLVRGLGYLFPAGRIVREGPVS